MLEDESDYLQIGQSDESNFHTFETTAPQPTSWTDFPTKEEPDKYFKYASFDIVLNQDVVVWSRQTYSTLDFLGDLGGLFDALKLIGESTIAPFSEFALKVTMMISLFKPKGSVDYRDGDNSDASGKKRIAAGKSKLC